MEDVLINFIQICRRCGLKVSIAESLDGARAAMVVGMKDRPTFKAALRAALIKRTKDMALFDQIFDAYFTDRPSDIPIEEMFGHGLPKPGEGDDEFDEAMRRAMEEMGGMDDLAKALLQGNVQFITAEMLQHMTPEQLAELRSMFQRGQLVRIVLDKMGWQKMQEQIRQLIEQLMRQGDYEAAQRVQERLWELQELFPKWVASEVNDRVEKQLQSERPPKPVERDVMDKDWGSYNEGEIRAMEEIVEQLARKLRKEWSRRAKAGGRKRLDVTRTMRTAMSTAGIPMELRWKQRKRNRLNIAVLCDVSSSVRTAARFMLQLVYSLQQQRGRVRSFVFIGDLDEVTETFERKPIDEAVKIATSESGITYWAHSDFGRTFRDFLDNYGDAINSRTTVIVLGDGRTNFYDPQYGALQEIKERSRRVLWLNPESEWGWGTGDSVAPQYARFCDRMVECRNLNQLQEAMEYLIMQGV
jgi:uncharacterized protein with von Willebrand factor type A (vWA) domain